MLPSILASPTTWSIDVGVFVPIPTLPLVSISSRLEKFVMKLKAVLVLVPMYGPAVSESIRKVWPDIGVTPRFPITSNRRAGVVVPTPALPVGGKGLGFADAPPAAAKIGKSV